MPGLIKGMIKPDFGNAIDVPIPIARHCGKPKVAGILIVFLCKQIITLYIKYLLITTKY